MKLLFVNPPNTTSLSVTEAGRYIEENIGNQFFPFPRIPFEVMAELNMEGFEKEILLLDFEWYKNPSLSKEKLIDVIERKSPDIILTTIIAQANADSIDWLTTKIKEKLPKSLIVLGGQAIGHFQEKIFKFCPNIDFALIGNPNKSLKKLIKHITNSKKSKIKSIEGLIYRKDGIVRKNDLTILQKPSNFPPEVMYDKYKNKISEIVRFVENKGAYVLGTIEFSKGCPFTCNFCAARASYLEKNISNVIKEIKYLYNLGIYKFYITDLTFGVNRKSRNTILDNLKKLKKEHKKFGFRCVTRADLITEEFVKKLSEAGCYEVGIGIECNEETVLNLMNKGISTNKNLRALDILGKSNISFKLFLIIGYPNSNTLTLKKTFELLNYLEDKKYGYFIQPALSRDILPLQQRFKEKEEKGILKRGTLSQLDFRHDCRKFGWDTNTSIGAICLLMLAYPSTELGKENRDIKLQKRILLDLPFLKDKVDINDLLNFLQKLPIDITNRGKSISLRKDLACLIDGVYSTGEIKEKIKKLHPDLNAAIIEQEIEFCLERLRETGLIDSFGNPNFVEPSYKSSTNKNIEPRHPKRKENIILFWNGSNQRYLYAPPDKEVIKIKAHFYKNIPPEVFEFLIFSKGVFSLADISNKLHCLFNKKPGFRNLEESRETTKRIYLTCKKYRLIY